MGEFVIRAADAFGLERHVLPASVREDHLSSYEGDRFVESMRYDRRVGEIPELLALDVGSHNWPDWLRQQQEQRR